MVTEIDERDAASRYREEAADNKIPVSEPPSGPYIPYTPYSAYSSDDDDEETIVAWEDNDPENPYNWSGRKKKGILLTLMMLIVNSTMGSALPSNAISFIAEEWNVVSEQQKVLPISVYLIGK